MKTMKQKPITVLGKQLNVGDMALDFVAVNNDLKDVSFFHTFKNDYVLISVVPSLDTSVCDIQTRTINERLASYKNVDFITISNDLPFAQKRWCGANGLTIHTLSDHKDLDFSTKYGLLIKELRLLARAVILLDQKRKVIYVEYLDEMSNHPNYDKLFNFLDLL
ncbi:thiol peroxidase [Acholeplasma granularum]|uniref:thiol peroxidase n=1 Tax=Acholeplasma granularum TaxID=264635 RepID=UPI000472E913|nr:thiol peroxidase [Acholeplasma granularum]